MVFYGRFSLRGDLVVGQFGARIVTVYYQGPFGIENETSRTASMSPKRFTRFLTSIMMPPSYRFAREARTVYQ